MDEFDIVDKLVLDGGLEFAGIDSQTGEALYKTTDKLKQIDPKLNNEISNYFSETTLNLWQKGFIEMDVTLEDPLVRLGSKSFDLDKVQELEKDERVIIQEIIRVLSGKE
jgi:hypothetical protein